MCCTMLLCKVTNPAAYAMHKPGELLALLEMLDKLDSRSERPGYR